MKILIPTRNRPLTQTTADALLAADVDFSLILTSSDTNEYDAKYPRVVAPDHVTDIMTKRNWILDAYVGQKILVIDDDISFHRVCDGVIIPAGASGIRVIAALMEKYLDDYAHGGVVPRFMAQNNPQPFILNKKPKSVLGYNLSLFGEFKPRFRLKACSDIDFTMQLIAHGLSCISITEFCYTEGSYMAPGGCSTWRTNETIKQGMYALRDLWPDYVKLREGPDKPGGTLATIYMKKLAKDSGC